MNPFMTTQAAWPLACIMMALSGGAALAGEQPATLPVAPVPSAPLVFAGSNAKMRAAWQQHLTLGAGDVLNFASYERPELLRTEVAIEPDGRVSYLQAQGVVAAGLTIDELRERMNAELGRHIKNPRVIVTPVAFKSRKVFLLGKVVNKGAYTLDRPMTILEAVAAAMGLETGLYQLNTVELADLPRSFLIRNSKRVPVDFEKLFIRGDLSQNILLEPDDYLYFPSAIANEIYVLGAVLSPGTQGLTSEATGLRAITLAGGYNEKAYGQRVLVVRGSIDQPRTFVVNTAAILAGRETDMRLEPRDIVYVRDKPWAKVEEVVDFAARAFIQTMVTTWTGENIKPLIKHPILPMLQY
ncbi:MAG: polysaccharide biosynthesis/export family protein [Pseudomonadota bacterium]